MQKMPTYCALAPQSIDVVRGPPCAVVFVMSSVLLPRTVRSGGEHLNNWPEMRFGNDH